MKGIYILYENDTIVYIGKSNHNMLNRIRTHNIDKYFNKCEMYNIDNEADISILELYMINKHKPIYNKDGKSVDMTTICIDEYKILGTPIDCTVDALKWRSKNISKTKDYIIANTIINELIDNGYTIKDVMSMVIK